MDLRLGGLETLGSEDCYDAVFALGILPYIADQTAYLARLRDHVAEGGCLIVSVTRSASLFTFIELARHLACFRFSRSWWWVATNLARTGIWSGGFVLAHNRTDIVGRGALDRIMTQAGFDPANSFALFNIASLDRAVNRRGAIMRRVADRLGWCVVHAYQRR